MNFHIEDNICFNPDSEAMIEHLRLSESSGLLDDFKKLLDEAVKIAKPKYMIKEVEPESISDTTVCFNNNITLESRILSKNIKDSKRVFLSFATAGLELEAWNEQYKNQMLENYWIGEIQIEALRCAEKAAVLYIMDNFSVESFGRMSPGSLKDWPLSEQSKLFELMGTTDIIGVSLTKHMAMVPLKTTSWIIFETEKHFENCMLCPKDGCPNRRAKYNPSMYDEQYK